MVLAVNHLVDLSHVAKDSICGKANNLLDADRMTDDYRIVTCKDCIKAVLERENSYGMKRLPSVDAVYIKHLTNIKNRRLKEYQKTLEKNNAQA